MSDPCTWPVDTSCLPPATTDAERARIAAATDAAVHVLWAITGRQFGTCAILARPCPTHADTAVCGMAGGCSPHGASVVALPGPVHRVLEVTVDGTVIAADSWAIEGDRLYRMGGYTWPAQTLTRPLGEPGTWAVRYERGHPPPAGAANFVGQLAAEFIKSCTTPDACALPRRVTSITRQGVTMQMADPQAIISAGGTGLPEVDLWVSAINPHRLAQPPAVYTPDQAVW